MSRRTTTAERQTADQDSGAPFTFPKEENLRYLTSYIKINSEQIKDLMVGGRPIQLLEGNTGLISRALGSYFLNVTPKHT